MTSNSADTRNRSAGRSKFISTIIYRFTRTHTHTHTRVFVHNHLGPVPSCLSRLRRGPLTLYIYMGQFLDPVVSVVKPWKSSKLRSTFAIEKPRIRFFSEVNAESAPMAREQVLRFEYDSEAVTQVSMTAIYGRVQKYSNTVLSADNSGLIVNERFDTEQHEIDRMGGVVNEPAAAEEQSDSSDSDEEEPTPALLRLFEKQRLSQKMTTEAVVLSPTKKRSRAPTVRFAMDLRYKEVQQPSLTKRTKNEQLLELQIIFN